MGSNISAWAIRNPIPVIVLFALLTAAGVTAFGKLRLNSAPDIDFPSVVVTIIQPGAAPAEMETQIARNMHLPRGPRLCLGWQMDDNRVECRRPVNSLL